MFRGGGGPFGIAGITGGQISGVTITSASGVPIILTKGGIPLIGLSSGSVAANGAISGITALPRVYPDAYCYFPANILATSIAAGFYYCTFSTTTAGTAFLNTAPATGTLTIPSSPTAVTDGRGAFTGDTGEEFGITLNVPVLTSTAAIRIHANFENTNNANAKTGRVRLSGQAGTVFLSESAASTAAPGFVASIQNTGSTAKQIGEVHGINVGAITPGVLGTVDTSVATTLVFSLQRATATDNFVLLPPIVEVLQ